MRRTAVAGFGGDGGDGHVRRLQQKFGACETLTADLFADRMAEVRAEECVEDRSPSAEGVGDLRRPDWLRQSLRDEFHRLADRRVGDGDDFRGAAHDDAERRDEDRLFRRTLARHQPVEKGGRLVSAALQVLVDGGKRHGLVLADRPVVADGEDREFLGNGDVQLQRRVEQARAVRLVVGERGDRLRRRGECAAQPFRE